MPISVDCPSCANRFKAPDRAAGRTAKCPICSAPIVVPGILDVLSAAPKTEGDIEQAFHGAGHGWGYLECQDRTAKGDLEKRLFWDFVGQEEIKNLLRNKITESIRSRRLLPHLLFCGPPESGKATLADLVAQALGVASQVMKGADVRKPADMLPYLTNLGDRSVLVIEDIDSLPESVCDFLAGAMGQFQIDIVLGDGVNARTISMNLKRFTLIGTTSKPSRVNRKVVQWLAVHDFEPYTDDEFLEVVRTMAIKAGLVFSPDCVPLLASSAQGSLANASVVIKKFCSYLGDQDNQPLSAESTTTILSWLGYEIARADSVTLADKLCAMAGSEFEEFVAQTFRKRGYSVEFTATSGDHGIDLLICQEGKRAVVQCKRWDSSVGEPVIRDFYGAMLNSGVQAGFVVTTGYFTRQAIAFAADKPITLVDMDALLTMCRVDGNCGHS